MKPIVIGCAIAATTLLAGCVGYSPQETQSGAGNASQLKLDIAPDVAYRRIVLASRNCFPTYMDTTADWFADSRSARITATMKVTFGVSTLYVAEIAPDGATGTQLSLATHKSASRIAATIRGWALGMSPTPCDM